MRTRRPLFVVLAGLAAAAAAPPAGAQNLATTFVMTPRPGAVTSLEAALQEHGRWRRDNGDPWSWHLWQVVNGENVGEFHARSVGHRWADYDSYYASDFARRSDAHFQRVVGPHLQSTASFISQDHPELSMPPSSGTPLGLAEVTVLYLDLELRDQFVQSVTAYRQAVAEQASTVPYVVATQVNGGPGPAMTIVRLCPDWACLGSAGATPLQVLGQHFGMESAARIARGFDEAVTHTTSFIAAYRPDLSVIAGGG